MAATGADETRPEKQERTESSDCSDQEPNEISSNTSTPKATSSKLVDPKIPTCSSPEQASGAAESSKKTVLVRNPLALRSPCAPDRSAPYYPGPSYNQLATRRAIHFTSPLRINPRHNHLSIHSLCQDGRAVLSPKTAAPTITEHGISQDMNYHFDEQRSAYSHPPNTSLGLTVPLSYQSMQRGEEEAAYLSSSSSNEPNSGHHHVNIHGGNFANQFAHPSGMSSSANVDDHSLSAIAHASHQANIDRRYISFPQPGQSHSQAYDAFSMGSVMDVNVNIYSGNRGNEQDPSYLTTGPPDGLVGRSRSNTVRRYDSMVSVASAPPGLGDEVEADRLHGYQDSPESMESFNRSPSAASALESPIQGSTTSVALHGRKKRNKCSPEQYQQLEAFFSKNRNPTGKVREELSKRIQMPERSVQVWFQNKRAKTKINEIKEGVPPEQRTTVSRSKMERTVSASEAQGKKRKTINESGQREQETVIQLPCSSLCIGDWRRIKPLICLFSRRNQCFTWYLSSESVGFKLECPQSCVAKVIFSGPTQPTDHEFSEGVNSPLGHLVLELERPPQFYMEVFRSSAKPSEVDISVQRASWRQCTDFTEGKQATTTLKHVVSGPYNLLRHAVMQLYQSNGVVSSLVEFQDHGYSEQPYVEQQQQQQHGNQLWGQSIPQPQPYSVVSHASHFLSPSTALAFPTMETQTGIYQAGPASGEQSSWPSSYQAVQTSPSQSLPPLHPALGASPMPSEGGLDLTALRIETAGLSNPDFTQPARVHPMHWSLPSSGGHHPHHHHHHYPSSSDSPSWSMSEHSHHASGSMSAPAYDVRSFEAQQRQPSHPLDGQLRSLTPTGES